MSNAGPMPSDPSKWSSVVHPEHNHPLKVSVDKTSGEPTIAAKELDTSKASCQKAGCGTPKGKLGSDTYTKAMGLIRNGARGGSGAHPLGAQHGVTILWHPGAAGDEPAPTTARDARDARAPKAAKGGKAAPAESAEPRVRGADKGERQIGEGGGSSGRAYSERSGEGFSFLYRDKPKKMLLDPRGQAGKPKASPWGKYYLTEHARRTAATQGVDLSESQKSVPAYESSIPQDQHLSSILEALRSGSGGTPTAAQAHEEYRRGSAAAEEFSSRHPDKNVGELPNRADYVERRTSTDAEVSKNAGRPTAKAPAKKSSAPKAKAATAPKKPAAKKPAAKKTSAKKATKKA